MCWMVWLGAPYNEHGQSISDAMSKYNFCARERVVFAISICVLRTGTVRFGFGYVSGRECGAFREHNNKPTRCQYRCCCWLVPLPPPPPPPPSANKQYYPIKIVNPHGNVSSFAFLFFSCCSAINSGKTTKLGLIRGPQVLTEEITNGWGRRVVALGFVFAFLLTLYL